MIDIQAIAAETNDLQARVMDIYSMLQCIIECAEPLCALSAERHLLIAGALHGILHTRNDIEEGFNNIIGVLERDKAALATF